MGGEEPIMHHADFKAITHHGKIKKKISHGRAAIKKILFQWLIILFNVRREILYLQATM